MAATPGGGAISASMGSVFDATLRRESCDCVSAVGVSGRSSSSEMGDGIRRLLSMSTCDCFLGTGGVCSIGLLGMPRYPLPIPIPPAMPLVGYPNPDMPPMLIGPLGALKVG